MRHVQRYFWQLQNHVWIHNFPQKQRKDHQAWKHGRFPRGPTIWKVMQKKCVEHYCEVANKNNLAIVQSIHSLSWGELKSVGELSDVFSQIVLKCRCLARIGRPEISWSVNKFACAITMWTRASDKRLARFISHFHFTSEYRKLCHLGKTAH